VERGGEMLAVHPRDDPEVDALGTRGLALAVERAGAEALDVRRGHQRPGAARALGLALGQEPEVGELRPHEQRGRSVGAGRDAGAAPDARRGIERPLGDVAADGHGIGLGRAARPHRDVAPGPHDAVQSAPVHDQIAHDREDARLHRLEPDRGALAERPQRDLTGGRPRQRPVRAPIHHDAAGPANALAAVAVEGHGRLAERDQPLVEPVERFEQRHLGADVVKLVANEAAGGPRVVLPRTRPDRRAATAASCP
jgi:hypothetical protein